jgi:hypothetical protein
MATVHQDCPFLKKLSPELRNMIYSLALHEEEEVDITTERTPPLLRTCRQIRNEVSFAKQAIVTRELV